MSKPRSIRNISETAKIPQLHKNFSKKIRSEVVGIEKISCNRSSLSIKRRIGT